MGLVKKYSQSRKNGITPKHHRGQNFLVDKNILGKIIATADIAPSETILEVGPGMGALTELLVKKAKRVVAVEIDKDLVEVLREKFASVKNLEIVKDDILEVSVPDVVSSYSIVANIPYNITSRFFRKFLEGDTRPERMVILLQKEVAQRMTARVPDMNLLALSVQLFSTIRIAFPVSRGCFSPRPRVDSAVVVLTLKKEKDLPSKEIRGAFFTLAKAAFSQKRKQCAQTIAKKCGIPLKEVHAAFEKCGVGTKARAEEISLEQWLVLARLV